MKASWSERGRTIVTSLIFFFSSRRRHTRFDCDWSSDVCSSDLALGTAQTLAWGTTYYLPAVLANSMAAELGVGTASVFVAFSAGLLLAGFLGPGSGRLIDVFGGRRVLSTSSLVLAAGLAFLGTASGPISMLLAWLAIGIGMSAGLYEAAFST